MAALIRAARDSELQLDARAAIRMQPTAQAAGFRMEMGKPRRGDRAAYFRLGVGIFIGRAAFIRAVSWKSGHLWPR